jgi:hypothetical protein
MPENKILLRRLCLNNVRDRQTQMSLEGLARRRSVAVLLVVKD